MSEHDHSDDTNEYCLSCGTSLYNIDEDPNGDQNCECARCRAESEHDFDEEPNVVFNRSGSRSPDQNDIVDKLYRETKILGLEHPTPTMIYDLICDVQFNTLYHPELVAAQHGLKWRDGKVEESSVSPLEKEDYEYEKDDLGQENS